MTAETYGEEINAGVSASEAQPIMQNLRPFHAAVSADIDP